jgi:hypothetical protein
VPSTCPKCQSDVTWAGDAWRCVECDWWGHEAQDLTSEAPTEVPYLVKREADRVECDRCHRSGTSGIRAWYGTTNDEQPPPGALELCDDCARLGDSTIYLQLVGRR